MIHMKTKQSNNLRVLAIVQARMSSVRLPGKVLKKIGDSPLISLLIKRLSKSIFN